MRWWPWPRRTALASPATAPEPVPTPAWKTLPPLQRAVEPIPLTAPVERLTTTLSSWADPRFLAPLGHVVNPDGPSGHVQGLARPVPAGASRVGRVALPTFAPSATGSARAPRASSPVVARAVADEPGQETAPTAAVGEPTAGGISQDPIVVTGAAGAETAWLAPSSVPLPAPGPQLTVATAVPHASPTRPAVALQPVQRVASEPPPPVADPPGDQDVSADLPGAAATPAIAPTLADVAPADSLSLVTPDPAGGPTNDSASDVTGPVGSPERTPPTQPAPPTPLQTTSLALPTTPLVAQRETDASQTQSPSRSPWAGIDPPRRSRIGPPLPGPLDVQRGAATEPPTTSSPAGGPPASLPARAAGPPPPAPVVASEVARSAPLAVADAHASPPSVPPSEEDAGIERSVGSPSTASAPAARSGDARREATPESEHTVLPLAPVQREIGDAPQPHATSEAPDPPARHEPPEVAPTLGAQPLTGPLLPASWLPPTAPVQRSDAGPVPAPSGAPLHAAAPQPAPRPVQRATPSPAAPRAVATTDLGTVPPGPFRSAPLDAVAPATPIRRTTTDTVVLSASNANPAVQRLAAPMAAPALPARATPQSLAVQRVPDPGAAALAVGAATSAEDGSVVFLSPAPASGPGKDPAPPLSATPSPRVVQRQEVPDAAPAGAEPGSAEDPVDTVPAPAATPAPLPGASATPDLDELARRLFDPLTARLRAELRLDRERAGVVTDLRS